MFTGIIESLGQVEESKMLGADVRLRFKLNLDMSDVHLGGFNRNQWYLLNRH